MSFAGKFSKAQRGTFEKRGRPRNDPVRERLRIYRAAGPLILKEGVRKTTVAAISEKACLSPGGIYHYFGSKKELGLYGLQPDALSITCLQAAEDLYDALACEPDVSLEEIVELYVEKNLQMIEFVRPALYAAIELGRADLRWALSRGIRQDADNLKTALKTIRPYLNVPEDSAHPIRRAILGLVLDESLSRGEIREQLVLLLTNVLRESSSTAAS